MTSAEIDKTYSPGQIVPHSGIYSCTGCDKEIAANHGDPFPPQNHHQHTLLSGAIRWKLIVWTKY
jgi:hypothetical protein